MAGGLARGRVVPDPARDTAIREPVGRGSVPVAGRDSGLDGSGLGPGGSGPSAPALVAWLSEVRELFPRETAEVIERHALDRYGLTELVTDPETLERLEPRRAAAQDPARPQGAPG